MTGATGAVLGIGLLERLREMADVETHLALSPWARSTIRWETGRQARDIAELADHSYPPGDQGAPISSGSFRTDGMVIIPCSMKTLAGIRTGYADGLVGRAADVTLKEHRKLVLVPRETPLSQIHLENMLGLARMGAVILPPMPAFYKPPGQRRRHRRAHCRPGPQPVRPARPWRSAVGRPQPPRPGNHPKARRRSRCLLMTCAAS
jgi:4-hydroxy-3-polyprenylbenzoate decarboxylase